MRDRLSTKILSNGATRYGVYDETGKLIRYEYIKLEDEPTVEGDLFSKANMLPDSIPALLGLKMANPQVKDALNVLANVGNLHVWQRVQTYAEPVPEVPAGYTLGAVEENVILASRETSKSTKGTFYYYYGDSVTVSKDGTVNAPSNDNYCLIGRDISPATIKTGPIFVKGSPSYISSGSGQQVADLTEKATNVFYIPSGGTLIVTVDSGVCYVVATKYQLVTGYPYTPAIPAGTTTDYLTSTDRNAYPDKSSDGSSYLLGESESKQVSEYYDTGTTRYLNLSYSDSVVISGGGSSVELNNPTTVKIGANASANFNVAKGKFCKFFQTSDTSVTVSITDLVFIPPDAEFSLTYPNSRYTVTCSKVQSVTVIPCTITYLGQLGGGARIEVGSYVGTGTYGSSNPNSLTFDFVPKVVMLLFVSAPVYGQNYAPTIYSLFRGPAYNPVMVTSMLTNSPQPNVGFMYNSNGGTLTYDYAWISSDKRTIYWYNTGGSTQQFNDLAYQTIPNTYHYVAIG